MAGYRLVIKQSITKDLRRIPKRDVGGILERIEALASRGEWPRAQSVLFLARRRYNRRRVGEDE